MQKLKYPFLNARAVKPQAFEPYFEEPKKLGEGGLHAILDAGKKWSGRLTKALNNGGSALFPHTFLSQCGDQIAAVVHAVLDSGADQALVLGVLHPMSEQLMQARSKELNEEDISLEPSRGVLGPGLDCDDCWTKEFSLYFFKLLFDVEVKRRGVKPPRLIERYPSLVNREPATLPGIAELERISKDSVVVATDDMCHHGMGYGVSAEEAIEMDEQGYQFAQKRIKEGYQLLKKGLYRDYFNLWMDPLAIGDPTDTALVLRHLSGEISGEIVELKLVDVSGLFVDDISPSWVAATLVEFK